MAFVLKTAQIYENIFDNILNHLKNIHLNIL